MALRKKSQIDRSRGENHPGAKYSDHEVELVRRLHDQGLGYKRIAQKMEMPVATVQCICTCRRRG